MSRAGYPEDLSTAAICQIEGHRGNGHCPDCGQVNYALLGYYGYIGRMAKKWGVTKTTAEARIRAAEEDKLRAEE